MLLAFWVTWIGQFAAMELSGNHRRGCRAISTEGACRGEVCHRVEARLHVRDGGACEDDHGQGHRQEHARDLIWARLDSVAAIESSKNQASSILLRHGCAWNRKTARGDLKSTWTGEYISWEKSADLGGGRLGRALRALELPHGRAVARSVPQGSRGCA